MKGTRWFYRGCEARGRGEPRQITDARLSITHRHQWYEGWDEENRRQQPTPTREQVAESLNVSAKLKAWVTKQRAATLAANQLDPGMNPPASIPEVEPPCPECKVVPPGHKISCKTGNERARIYQKGLENRYRNQRKQTVSCPAAKARLSTQP